MKDDDLMPFGKHKGEKLGDIPASYLLWCADNFGPGKYPDLVAYVEKNRMALEKEILENRYR